MKCPQCGKRNITAAHIMGHSSWKNPTERQRESSRINGRKGGRPRKNKTENETSNRG